MFYPPLMEALRRVTGPTTVDAPDAELLARFVQSRDEAAFAALVRRHGGLVWGACRRRLRDAHAAEDAFQTTFLALARHAASVRRPDALGGWLHRVAVRCSAGFRPPRESMSPPPTDLPAREPEPATAVAGRELERVIDAEIDRLPEPFRQAFVLCEVEQRTAADAARALGCPVGTVESRLSRARLRLRDRLARRGITVGALAGLGLAAVPVPASARTGAIALGVGTSPIPAAWAALADRAARAVSGVTLSAGLIGGVALVGLSGLVWSLSQGSYSRPVSSPTAQARVAADVSIPEQDQFRRNRFNFPLPPEAIARVGDPWLRHGTIPNRMSFSSDGRFLAAAGPGDRWLRVWDLSTGRPLTHIPLAPNEVPAAVALSDDGATLRALVHIPNHTGEAKASQLREYDTFRNLETRRRRVADGPTDTAAFSADGMQLAIVSGRNIRLIQASTAVDLWQTELNTKDGGRVDLAFSQVGGRIAVLPAGTDRIRLIDQVTGRLEGELVDADANLSLPTFSGDGRRLAALCSTTRRVRIWDVGTRRVDLTIVADFSVGGLTFSPNGEHVAIFGGFQPPRLWPARADGPTRQLEDCGGGVCGKFTPDGKLLAVATQDGAIQMFDGATGRRHAHSQHQFLTPTPVRFGLDGRLLVDAWQNWLDYPANGEDAPRVYDPGAGPNEPFLTGAADRASLSPDRSLLARCTRLSRTEPLYALDLFNVATGSAVKQIPLDGIARRPTFSPDGRVVYAVCADRLIHGWDVRTGQEVMRGKQRAGDLVNRLLVSPDGRYLATAVLVLADVQRADSIQLWDAATGASLLSIEAGQARPYIAFSPDGRLFAATVVSSDPQANAHEVKVWDLPSKRVVATFAGYDGQPAISPDGRTVAVTKVDAVILLEMATGRPRHAFRHHGKVEPNIAWRGDGRVIAAASPEAPVYLWDVVGDRTAIVPEWDDTKNEQRWSALTGEDRKSVVE